MALRNKPYDQFGPYLLFKKLESDAVSELWRAAELSSAGIGPLVALRRFTAGNSDALIACATRAALIAPSLTGTSFVRDQVIGTVGATAFVKHEYAGGRSLRHIMTRARGGNGLTAHPIPLDLAIAITEKIALSLATTAGLRYGTEKLSHGALLPQFVWISDEGETRVAGQQLGAGLLASLSDAPVVAEIGRYFSPESRISGDVSRTSDVYSLGAILYLLVTGAEPPDSTTSSAFTQTVRAARTMTGDAVPDDIRGIIEKTLTLDPAARYASIAEAKQALSAVANSGAYSATTFNLAFFITTLLKKELESEAIDREKESKLNIAPYLAAPAADAAESVAFPAPATTQRRRMPLLAAATAGIAAIGAGVWFMASSHSTVSAAKSGTVKVAAATVTSQPAPQASLVSQPLVASAPPAALAPQSPAPATTTADAAARKAAFERAVEQKLQEEMMKLQADYNRQLQQQQSKHAPIQLAAATPALQLAPAPAKEDGPSAAQLDQQHLTTTRQDTPLPTLQPATATTAIAAAAQAQAQAAPLQAAPAVHEGDVLEVSALDTVPHVIRAVPPAYPVMAAHQRVETTVLLTALISETGEVLDVRVLRGDKRFGFEDAAIRAVRATRFSPAVKDGKRVKTWFPVPVAFKI